MFGNISTGCVVLPGIAFLKVATWTRNSLSFVPPNTQLSLALIELKRIRARRPGRMRGAQPRAAGRRVAVVAVADREVMAIPEVRGELAGEQVLAHRDREHAVFRREQAKRVDRLLRILLRSFERTEVKDPVFDDRPAEAAAGTGTGGNPAWPGG